MFKVGDKVRRKQEYIDDGNWEAGVRVFIIIGITLDSDKIRIKFNDDRLVNHTMGWKAERFELVSNRQTHFPKWL